MNQSDRPSWHPRISLRTLLEAMCVLGLIVAVAREYRDATLKPGDLLEIRVVGTLPDEPIDGLFQLDPDGKLSLGPTYGRVAVENLSIDDITALIDKQLRTILREPEVSVARPNIDRALQQLQDENRWLANQLSPHPPLVVMPTGIQEEASQLPINIRIDSRQLLNMGTDLINDLPSNRLNYPPAERTPD